MYVLGMFVVVQIYAKPEESPFDISAPHPSLMESTYLHVFIIYEYMYLYIYLPDFQVADACNRKFMWFYVHRRICADPPRTASSPVGRSVLGLKCGAGVLSSPQHSSATLDHGYWQGSILG